MHSLFNDQMHVHVVLRRAYTVNTGYRCNNDCVVSFKYCPGCRMPHSVYIVINKCVFLYVCVSCRDISLRLLIVVVADKKLNSIIRKEFFKFSVELGCKSLVMSNHNGWLFNICDHIRNCQCLSGPCNAQKNLVFNPVFNASCKLIYCIWLITLWSKRGNKLECVHTNILNDFYTLLGGYGI